MITGLLRTPSKSTWGNKSAVLSCMPSKKRGRPKKQKCSELQKQSAAEISTLETQDCKKKQPAGESKDNSGIKIFKKRGRPKGSRNRTSSLVGQSSSALSWYSWNTGLKEGAVCHDDTIGKLVIKTEDDSQLDSENNLVDATYRNLISQNREEEMIDFESSPYVKREDISQEGMTGRLSDRLNVCYTNSTWHCCVM